MAASLMTTRDGVDQWREPFSLKEVSVSSWRPELAFKGPSVVTALAMLLYSCT